MRTSQKNIAKLYREVREYLGVKTNREAGKEISKLREYFEEKLKPEFVAVMFGPYRNSDWTLSGMAEGAQWCSMRVDVAEFAEPEKIVETFLNKDWK